MAVRAPAGGSASRGKKDGQQGRGVEEEELAKSTTHPLYPIKPHSWQASVSKASDEIMRRSSINWVAPYPTRLRGERKREFEFGLLEEEEGEIDDSPISLHLSETKTSISTSSFGRLTSKNGSRTTASKENREGQRARWKRGTEESRRTEVERASCP